MVEFGKPPWKLIVHLLLALFTSAQIIAYVELEVPYYAASKATWYKLFFPPDFTNADGTGKYYIYSIAQAASIFNNTAYTYFNMDNVSVDFYIYSEHGSADDRLIDVEAHVYEEGLGIFTMSRTPSLQHKTKRYRLVPNAPLGPLTGRMDNASALAEFFDTLIDMTVTFKLITAEFEGDMQVFHRWTISMYFDFTLRGGRMILSMTFGTDIIRDWDNIRLLFSRGLLWMDPLIIALAVLSLVMAVNTAIQSFYLIQRYKRKLRGASGRAVVGWRQLPLRKRVRLFNRWFVVTAAAAVLTITSSLLGTLYRAGVVPNHPALAVIDGLGCALAWVTLLRYFQSFAQFYVLVGALSTGLPAVGRVLLTSVPILLAYTFFGMILFSEWAPEFASFDDALASLFATISGDDLYHRFQALDGAAASWWLQLVVRLYEYSFVCLVAYAILNIVIAVFVEASNQAIKRSVITAPSSHDDADPAAAAVDPEKDAAERKLAMTSSLGELAVGDDSWSSVLELRPMSVRNVRDSTDFGVDPADGDGEATPLLATNPAAPRVRSLPLVASADESVDKPRRRHPTKGSTRGAAAIDKPSLRAGLQRAREDIQALAAQLQAAVERLQALEGQWREEEEEDEDEEGEDA